MLSDEDLAFNVVQGDKQAFAELVKRYEKPIFALAYRMVGNPEDAKDVAQEAFLKAYRAMATFKENSRFSPWLYAIANNLCIDFLRRKGRNNLSLDEALPEGGERQIPGGIEPSKAYEQLETKVLVQKVLNKLPEKYKNVLILRHMQDLSYEEIAQTLGISVSLVKTHLFRAREALRQQLILLSGEGEQSEMSKRPLGTVFR
ncbi:MAG TPA: sigma-70 family RNA polymerase sigma factor [Candidatus Deferrimicrobium sp.]|nr:sigma-70 family RNA polymerase sigma factor [Candidatus Deferrimicrobium sp.]